MKAVKSHPISYSQTQNVTLSEVFIGFSERLNTLLDMTSLDIPDLGSGRITWVAQTFEATPPSAYNWLKMDCPPLDGIKSKNAKKPSLHRIAEFLIDNLDGKNKRPSVRSVLGWLRYGEEFVGNPF